MLEVQNISGGYGEQLIVKNVSFIVEKGRMLGILGPNGSGKSTLLKMITGVIQPKSGDVHIDSKPLARYNAKTLARKMAVLPQLHANAFSNTVREAVSLGRFPHQTSFFASWSREDEEAVTEAMAQTGVTKYANTSLQFLSGGEQQRVFIAQALAQRAQIILLDEPTNHLDIAHQKQILDMLRRETVEKGLTVVSIFHDINLASLYCDELLLMEQGEVKFHGAPHEVVQREQLEAVYDARVSTYVHPEIAKPQMMILPAIAKRPSEVTLADVRVTKSFIQLQAKEPLKVISSAVHNAGLGWYTTLLNRSVPVTYNDPHVAQETLQFLQLQKFQPTDTVVMMTAVETKHVAMRQYAFAGGSVIIVVTAAIGHAVDATRTYERQGKPTVGTINTWIIVNGKLTDEAFYQAMMTATEAKTRSLFEANIKDAMSGTFATSTATDSLLVGATQQGSDILYAGPITELGKVIGKGVFEVTLQAILNTRGN